MKRKQKTRYCKECKKELHSLRIGSRCPLCEKKKRESRKKYCLRCKKLLRRGHQGKHCSPCKIEIKREKKKATKKYQESKIKTLKELEWNIISKVVRLQGANEQGYNTCYTCYNRFHWKELQAGHYKHGCLDGDLRNLKPQCVKCNKWGHGRLDKYAEHLIKDYGIEWFNRLVLDAHTEQSRTIEEMEKNIEILNNILNKLDQLK